MNEQLYAAKKVLKKLERAGYEAYLVGGCVRDKLLRKEPADYDITTNALPSKVQSLFSHTIPTGLQHGTVTVVYNKQVMEVTTYRIEGSYVDHRRPDEVQFVSQLKDDLMRRDFTINALAMDHQSKVYDFVNGQKDLELGWIRTVGKAEERFAEDALRMLRACRFAAQLSFQIDATTLQAIEKCKSYANHLAVERVVVEFSKIWKAKHSSKGLIPLVQTYLVKELPPFYNTIRDTNITDQEWGVLDKLKSSEEKWIYFLYLVFRENDISKQVCFANISQVIPKFKFSNTEKGELLNLLFLISTWDTDITIERGKLLLLHYHIDMVQKAQRLWQYITRKQNVSLPFDSWWKQMPIHHFSELAINGNDLLRVTGKPAGPWLKETLQYLYQQVAFGYIQNIKVVLEKEGGNYGAGLTS
ncbi:CCA tRNA nucleotidyltransferase [Shimazuella kribbensis]|uniref:CCA tRNA nucleotidyltransferase n=1 Tax=Shimazuella kribbensis TaxID=139808 RepID=UPI0004048EC4|nr:CCA tRNA nucleotidyltransferase [Shimazuella kribbensis]